MTAPIIGRGFTWDDVDKTILERVGITVRGVRWFSTYHVHHRVVDRFRAGTRVLGGRRRARAQPRGRAGYEHRHRRRREPRRGSSPTCWRGRAHASILDTYDPERRAFALGLVATTDRLFTLATRDGALARWVRIARRARGAVRLRSGPTLGRAYLFSATVSQTRVQATRRSTLSEGHAGTVHAGDRLPWFAQTGDGADDNFAPLRSRWWQAHVYGDHKPGLEEVRATCERRGIPLDVQIPWRAGAGDAGLEQGALYLVRPDGHLGYAPNARRAPPRSSITSTGIACSTTPRTRWRDDDARERRVNAGVDPPAAVTSGACSRSGDSLPFEGGGRSQKFPRSSASGSLLAVGIGLGRRDQPPWRRALRGSAGSSVVATHVRATAYRGRSPPPTETFSPFSPRLEPPAPPPGRRSPPRPRPWSRARRRSTRRSPPRPPARRLRPSPPQPPRRPVAACRRLRRRPSRTCRTQRPAIRSRSRARSFDVSPTSSTINSPVPDYHHPVADPAGVRSSFDDEDRVNDHPTGP